MSHGATPAEKAPLPLPPEARDPWPDFLRTMFWVGLNTFGGPVAQIGVMQRVAVEKKRWLTDGQFMHLLNFANILPGPEALEIAIHLGYLRRGVAGGIVAGLLFIWPGFVSLTFLGWLYREYGNVPSVVAFMDGVRPVALALVAAAAVRISRRALKGGLSYVLMGAAFLASYLFRAPFIAVLVVCGFLGFIFARYRREGKVHGRFQGAAFAVLVVGFVAGANLWQHATGCSSLPIPADGPGEVREPDVSPYRLAQIAWLNTKAALLTFGGAYTVLPYLREQTVHHYGWMTDPQMIDALALGETTPGPLISIGVFISYIAGDLPGAAVGCFFLFLPSFLLVLGLGRYIDRVERLPHAEAILWGFSAGTLGLIVALASLLVGSSLPDLFSIGLAAAAFLVVWKLDFDLISVVLAGGLLGLLRAHLS